MKHFNFVNVRMLRLIYISYIANTPSFCLILKVSHALVCSVYSLGSNTFAEACRSSELLLLDVLLFHGTP